MFAVVIALFFAAAAIFAVLSIAQTFSGAADRIDALFAAYRAVDEGRWVQGSMRPVTRYVPVAAPDYAPRTVVTLPVRAAGGRISRPDWRAAA